MVRHTGTASECEGVIRSSRVTIACPVGMFRCMHPGSELARVRDYLTKSEGMSGGGQSVRPQVERPAAGAARPLGVKTAAAALRTLISRERDTPGPPGRHDRG